VFLTPEVGSLRGFFYCAEFKQKKQQKKQKKLKKNLRAGSLVRRGFQGEIGAFCGVIYDY